jgi:hypothetical protein
MSISRVQVRNFLIVFLPLALLFVGPCFYVGYTRIPPKEAKLIQNFNKHRAAFEQLRDMLLTDTNLSRVAGWGVETHKPFFLGYPSDKDFPTDRFKKYLALLKEAGGKMATRGKGMNADPAVGVWGWGWAGTTRHIGVCWLNQEPTNQISTLDSFRYHHSNPEHEWFYRHIDSQWYFWTDL